MKKFASAFGVLMASILGVFLFVGCTGKAPETAQYISFNQMEEYINQEFVTSEFGGFKYKAEYFQQGQSLGTVNLMTFKLNENVCACMDVDIKQNGEHIFAKVYLYDGKVYINNGVEKYFVSYAGFHYGDNEVMVIVDVLLKNILQENTTQNILARVKDELQYATIQCVEEEGDRQFNIFEKVTVVEADKKMEVEGTTQLQFERHTLSKISATTTNTSIFQSESVVSSSNIVIESYSDRFLFPNFSGYVEKVIG